MGLPGDPTRSPLLRLACAAVLLAGSFAAAQTTKPLTVSLPPTPLLPETVNQPGVSLTADQVSRAKLSELTPNSFDQATCLPVLSASGAPAAAGLNGAAAGDCLTILKEDALLRVAATRYRHTNAPGEAGEPVAAFELDDATGAYSAYTFFRSRMHDIRISSPDRKALTNSAESTTGNEGTLIWSGTAILRSGGRLSPAEIAALVATLPKAGGRKALAPLLPTFFPADGLDRTSIRYALGPAGYAAMGGVLPANIVDWGRSAEVATSAYAGRGGKGSLTLLLFPTPQIAGIQGRTIEGAMNAIPAPDRAARFGSAIKLRRLGPLVILATGGFSVDRAAALAASVRLNEEVTFDKKQPPTFHAEVTKTASLLQNIATFIGVMLAAAVLLAVFLGGARAGIRVLQGKPAASEPEFLTINLRGKSEHIHFDVPPDAPGPPEPPKS